MQNNQAKPYLTIQISLPRFLPGIASPQSLVGTWVTRWFFLKFPTKIIFCHWFQVFSKIKRQSSLKFNLSTLQIDSKVNREKTFAKRWSSTKCFVCTNIKFWKTVQICIQLEASSSSWEKKKWMLYCTALKQIIICHFIKRVNLYFVCFVNLSLLRSKTNYYFLFVMHYILIGKTSSKIQRSQN